MKRILCYGDSNTWGLIAGTNDRYEWGIRWTSRLQKALSEAGFQVVEEGLCGRTTVHQDAYRPGRSGLEMLPVLLESHAPLDLVILMLVSPIFLGEQVWKEEYDPEFSLASVEITKKLPHAYQEIASKRHIEFLAASDHAWPSQTDHGHMDEEGHRKLAEALTARVKKIFREGS